MAKVLIISGMVCALSSGCKKGDEATETAAGPRPPQAAAVPAPSPAEKSAPPPWDTEARIARIKKELCADCGPESSQCEVEDLYEFPRDGKKPRRLIAYSSPGGGPNASYTVILSTKDACTPVLEESGTGINFIPKPNRNDFPDIGVTSHWNAEESVGTGYHWDGHNYVAEGSVKTNAGTGAEESL